MSDHKKMAAKEILTALGSDVAWHKNTTRKAMTLAFVFGIYGLVSTIIFCFVLFSKEPPRMVGLTTDLRAIELQEMTEQHITNASLLHYVGVNAARSLTMTFTGYKEELTSLRDIYVESGWQSLVASLKDQGILDLIKDRRLNTTAYLQGPPTIVNEGETNYAGEKRYAWVVDVPIDMTYEGSRGRELAPQRLIARMTVVRVSLNENITGVKILRTVFSPRGGA